MLKKVTARHFDLTPEIRARAEEEMEGLTRFFDRIISAEYVLDAERHRRSAELRVKVHAHMLSAKAETDDIKTAITGASDKIKAQLKKFKGKLKEKDPTEITELTSSITRPETDVDAVDM
ncbi:MAG: ribosome-associated translation inhibitor RaiA [Candidatus Zixiibacteriota bacterium]